MTKLRIIVPAALLSLIATNAGAQTQTVGVSTGVTNYSGSFGKRTETTFESNIDLGDTTFVIGAARGKREFLNEDQSATQIAGSIYRDWSDRFYTRTRVALSSKNPVYASRDVATDLNFKLLPQTVVMAGSRHATYFGDRDVLSWSGGATQYFGGGFVQYRFTAADVESLGNTHSHLLSFRLSDGKGPGHSQVWISGGTSLHEQEAALSGRPGSFRNIAVQRVQPLSGPVSLNLTLSRGRYDTGLSDYKSTKAMIGLSFSR